MKQQITFEFEMFDTVQSLPSQWSDLVLKSKVACALAYAPYSKFHVGAAALLEGGEVVVGSNKENASFPAGTCAERNVLHAVSDRYPGKRVLALAISAEAEHFDFEATLAPCGICRQVICEVEKMQKHNIVLLMHSPHGKVLKTDCASDLLPFHFYLPELKK